MTSHMSAEQSANSLSLSWYEDAQDIEQTRTRLASIGFRVRPVDQPLTKELSAHRRRRFLHGCAMGGAGLEPAATCV